MLLQENPSLKLYNNKALDYAYKRSVDIAMQETNLLDATFPGENPYPIEQILDFNFLSTS